MSRILAGALVVATAMAGTIYWEMQGPAGPDLSAATPGRSPLMSTVRAAPGPDTNSIMQGWVSTALERPVFREDRRPTKTSEDVAATGAGPTRLTGVITGPFGNRAIFMTAAENAKPLVVKEGARVGDFVVRTIEPGHVVVESDGMVRTMKLTFTEAAKTPRP
jgi:hypothetical protein